MAFREGQPTGWLGAGPQGLPEERAHAPQMPMRSRAPVGSYPEPDVEEVGPNNPSRRRWGDYAEQEAQDEVEERDRLISKSPEIAWIWHSAQVANFMKTVLLYVFMHTNAAVASGIQSLMKERRDLHDRVESGLLPGEQWMDWQGNKFTSWHTGPSRIVGKETSADCCGEHLGERRDLHGTVKTGFPFLDEEEEDLSPPPLDEEVKLVSRVDEVLMKLDGFLREEEEKEEEEEKKAKANARHNHSD